MNDIQEGERIEPFLMDEGIFYRLTTALRPTPGSSAALRVKAIGGAAYVLVRL